MVKNLYIKAPRQKDVHAFSVEGHNSGAGSGPVEWWSLVPRRAPNQGAARQVHAHGGSAKTEETTV